jgi:predicted nucleic acid-binding protein
MKRIFLDANVIISVLNREYPLFRMSSRVLSLSENPAYKLCTSATSLAICFYFATKKSGENKAREKIKMLCEWIEVAEAGNKEVHAALANPKVLDFEDGIQYYSAKHSGCQFIITENQNDFYFSEIKVMNCEHFLRHVVLSS